MRGSVKVMVASKEVLVSFVGRGADWAFGRVMPVDAMFLRMGGEPIMDQFNNEYVYIVGKSVDGSAQTQPINQIAGIRGPGEFLAKVRAHVA